MTIFHPIGWLLLCVGLLLAAFVFSIADRLKLLPDWRQLGAKVVRAMADKVIKWGFRLIGVKR